MCVCVYIARLSFSADQNAVTDLEKRQTQTFFAIPARAGSPCAVIYCHAASIERSPVIDPARGRGGGKMNRCWIHERKFISKYTRARVVTLVSSGRVTNDTQEIKVFLFFFLLRSEKGDEDGNVYARRKPRGVLRT